MRQILLLAVLLGLVMSHRATAKEPPPPPLKVARFDIDS